MTRYECLQLIAPLMTDHLVVTSQSGQRIEWNHLSDHEGNLLLGMMGCALGVGIGLALARQLGIDPATVHLWESGRRRPSKRFLGIIETFFNSIRLYLVS